MSSKRVGNKGKSLKSKAGITCSQSFIVQSTELTEKGTIKLRGWNREYGLLGIIRSGLLLIEAGLKSLEAKELARETPQTCQNDARSHNPAKSSSAEIVKVRLEKLQNNDAAFPRPDCRKNRK